MLTDILLCVDQCWCWFWCWCHVPKVDIRRYCRGRFTQKRNKLEFHQLQRCSQAFFGACFNRNTNALAQSNKISAFEPHSPSFIVITNHTMSSSATLATTTPAPQPQPQAPQAPQAPSVTPTPIAQSWHLHLAIPPQAWDDVDEEHCQDDDDDQDDDGEMVDWVSHPRATIEETMQIINELRNDPLYIEGLKMHRPWWFEERSKWLQIIKNK